jgi:uncharacterized membrane-anchored protein YjiN (DUF445 family)
MYADHCREHPEAAERREAKYRRHERRSAARGHNIINDEEYDRLTRQAFDDLHRIAEALEKMSAERLISDRLIERLAETALQVSRRIQ